MSLEILDNLFNPQSINAGIPQPDIMPGTMSPGSGVMPPGMLPPAGLPDPSGGVGAAPAGLEGGPSNMPGFTPEQIEVRKSGWKGFWEDFRNRPGLSRGLMALSLALSQPNKGGFAGAFAQGMFDMQKVMKGAEDEITAAEKEERAEGRLDRQDARAERRMSLDEGKFDAGQTQQDIDNENKEEDQATAKERLEALKAQTAVAARRANLDQEKFDAGATMRTAQEKQYELQAIRWEQEITERTNGTWIDPDKTIAAKVYDSKMNQLKGGGGGALTDAGMHQEALKAYYDHHDMLEQVKNKNKPKTKGSSNNPSVSYRHFLNGARDIQTSMLYTSEDEKKAALQQYYNVSQHLMDSESKQAALEFYGLEPVLDSREVAMGGGPESTPDTPTATPTPTPAASTTATPTPAPAVTKPRAAPMPVEDPVLESANAGRRRGPGGASTAEQGIVAMVKKLPAMEGKDLIVDPKGGYILSVNGTAKRKLTIQDLNQMLQDSQ